MNAADVFFLLIIWAAIIAVGLLGFFLGWTYRDEHQPHPAMRTVIDALLEERPRVAAWLGGPWRVPVRWHELPPFVRARARDKGMSTIDDFRPWGAPR